MKRIVLVGLLALFLALPVTAQDGPYRFAKEIPIPGDGSFDYLSVDSAAHRLFVSHGTKIVVVDTERDRIGGEITEVAGVHGLTLGSDLGRGFTANGGEDTVSIVELSTLKTLQKVKTGSNPDTIAYDPVHHNVYAFGKGDGSGTVFDARSGEIVGTFPFSSSGGDGTVTIAHEDTPGTLTHVQTLTTKRGARTMTVDPSTHRIYLAVPDFEAPAPGQTGRPKAIPGTFRVLVYEMAPIS